MALEVGSRLGSYEVVSRLGAGGMGEVYRARDARLGRDIALKVLPDIFAQDSERMARFEREAHLLASLNHPNIAALYGLEESGGARALVMELVEGQTLAERIAGGAMPPEEALAAAKQIAEALEYAHEHGIVHRDLKPANVKVTADGAVKVLDFGLAKALDDGPAVASTSNSPTLSMAATRAGVLLGTAAYMSPEQAKGKPVDRRADIWAFGVVLMEMLTGRPLYSAETAPETLAAVMRDEPRWDRLPPETPVGVHRLLRRCLDKDPRRRLRDIGEARIAIEEILTGAPREQPAPPPRSAAPAGVIIPWAVAIAAVAAAIWGWQRSPQSASRPVVRWSTAIAPVPVATFPGVTLSPDGARLAWLSGPAGSQQIHVRMLDQLEGKPLSGTEGARGLFFSPDGQWIGFVVQGKLKRVPVAGGASVTLCDARGPWGASWGPDDTIVFGAFDQGLSRVAAAGGTPQVLTTPDPKKGESAHRYPQVLPGGKGVLFTIATGISTDDWRVAVFNIPTGETRILAEGGSDGRYTPSGHLVYARAGTLFAAPFDVQRLERTGPQVSVLEGVRSQLGFAEFSFSESGALVYVPGGSVTANRTLVWVDRKGAAQPLPAPPRPYLSPRLSPDGERVAVNILGNNGQSDIWLYELARGTLTRLTFEFDNNWPVWTPDGKRVTYASERAGKFGLFWTPADGSGSPEPLVEPGDTRLIPNSWSPDGKTLVFFKGNIPRTDLWIVSPEPADRQPRPFLDTPFDERGGYVSPDGRWIAYSSNESGQPEIYVQPFPNRGTKWQVSTDGSLSLRWARNGREVFYRSDNRVMAVDVSTAPTFKAGAPKPLFEWPAGVTWDVAPDGQRFLMVKEGEDPTSAPGQVRVVMEWFEELKRRVPPGNQ